jgi:hypothetical protein
VAVAAQRTTPSPRCRPTVISTGSEHDHDHGRTSSD